MLGLLDFWSRIRDYLTVSLAVGFVVCAAGWHFTSVSLANEREGRKNDRAAYVTEQRAFDLKAEENKITTERKFDEQKKKADSGYVDLLAKYNASLLRYQTSQRKVSKSGLPSTSKASEGGDGSSASPQFLEGSVEITVDDAQICAENTARLVKVQEWTEDIARVSDSP